MDALLTALKAAAEPTRLRLLVLCAGGDLTVSDLTQILGQSQPRVSRHLKVLCEAGLLHRVREGSWAYFRLADGGPGADLARRLVESVPADDATAGLDRERLESVLRGRAERAADYFRRNAGRWDSVRSLYVDEAEVERHLLIVLPPEQVHELVDVGTGTGRILEILGPRVRRAIGVDLSTDMLLLARSKLERAGLRHCSVRKGDMYQLPLPTASADAVTLHQVLHFAERPAAVIAEAARLLRPGGKLVLVDFLAHAHEALRQEHAHRWLGFRDPDIAGWCAVAGLVAQAPIHLPGSPLTVGIWTAERPAQARPAAAA